MAKTQDLEVLAKINPSIRDLCDTSRNHIGNSDNSGYGISKIPFENNSRYFV